VALTLGIANPRDALAKLEHDFSDLETAVFTQEETRIGYALINFAIAAYHIKDWLIRNKPRSYSARQVEDFVASSAAISSCRDICNAGKHVSITQYEPTTADVTASATAVTSAEFPNASPILRVKIVRKDGSRHEALDLATQALKDWYTFFETHKV
jgi:hypothetical protein